MYAHVEDWTRIAVPMLEKKGLPHGENAFKVYVSDGNPSEELGLPNLEVWEVPDDPFGPDDVFDYRPEGDRYTGPDLEATIATHGLSEIGNDLASRTIRALHRVSHDKDFTRAGMFDHNGSSLTPHPFDVVDGIDDAVADPLRVVNMHLDLFLPGSVERVMGMVSLDPDAGQVASFRQGTKWRRTLQQSLR